MREKWPRGTDESKVLSVRYSYRVESKPRLKIACGNLDERKAGSRGACLRNKGAVSLSGVPDAYLPARDERACHWHHYKHAISCQTFLKISWGLL